MLPARISLATRCLCLRKSSWPAPQLARSFANGRLVKQAHNARSSPHVDMTQPPKVVGKLVGPSSEAIIRHAMAVNYKSPYFSTAFYCNEMDKTVNCGKGGDKRVVHIGEKLSMSFLITIANTTNYATQRKRIFRRLREALQQQIRRDPSLLPTRPMTLQLTPTMEALHAPWEDLLTQTLGAYQEAKAKLEKLPPTRVKQLTPKRLSPSARRRLESAAQMRGRFVPSGRDGRSDDESMRARGPNEFQSSSAEDQSPSRDAAPSSQDRHRDPERRSHGRLGDRYRQGQWHTDSARDSPATWKTTYGSTRYGSSTSRDSEPLLKYSPGDRRKRPEVRGDVIRYQRQQAAEQGRPAPEPQGLVKQILDYSSGSR